MLPIRVQEEDREGLIVHQSPGDLGDLGEKGSQVLGRGKAAPDLVEGGEGWGVLLTEQPCAACWTTRTWRLRLAPANVQAFQLELVGLHLPGRPPEGLAAPCDLHIDEPSVLHGGNELRFQQSTAYSSGPDFNVLPCCRWNVLIDDDVSNLDPAARLQDSEGLTKHCSLVGAEVDHAV